MRNFKQLGSVAELIIDIKLPIKEWDGEGLKNETDQGVYRTGTAQNYLGLKAMSIKIYCQSSNCDFNRIWSE